MYFNILRGKQLIFYRYVFRHFQRLTDKSVKSLLNYTVIDFHVVFCAGTQLTTLNRVEHAQ